MNQRETKRNDAGTSGKDAETSGDDATHWRLFCAITLSPEVRSRAAEHIARLRAALPRVRASWERTEKLHLTLKFFGNVEPARAPALSLALDRAADSTNAFNLSIADAGSFPTHGPPRVLWLGVRDSSNTLAQLHQALENECAAAGFPREERPYHPHLTLARLRSPTGTRELASLHKETGFPALDLTVNEIILMRSHLDPNGSRYTVLSRHSLAF